MNNSDKNGTLLERYDRCDRYTREISKKKMEILLYQRFFSELKKYQIREHEKEFKKEKKRKENVKFTKKYLITLNTSLHRYRWNDTNLAEGKSYTSGRYIDARVCMRTRVYLKSWRTLLPSCSIHERNTHTRDTRISYVHSRTRTLTEEDEANTKRRRMHPGPWCVVNLQLVLQLVSSSYLERRISLWRPCQPKRGS